MVLTRKISDNCSPDDLSPCDCQADSLDGLARQLAEITAATEEEFLVLGAHLGDYQNQARQTARRAELAAGSLSGKTAGEIGGRLQALLHRLEQHRQEQERICAGESLAIDRILHRLGRLEEPLAAFRRIVKTLHTLGIAIRIESSAGARSSDSVHLADELRELATMIGARSALVCDRLTGLGASCTRAWQRLDEMLAGQDNVSKKLLQQAGGTLERLVADTCEATGEADRISSRTVVFAREIGEVVASIQFQDIVRQKVDHIRRALTDAEKEKVAAGEICLLQAGHLRLAHEEMRQAGRRIVDNLRLLAQKVSATAAEGKTDPELGGGREETVFQQMEGVIAEMTLLLQAGVIARQQTAEAIAAVRDSVQQMESFLGEIDLLGEKMKVVALNAAIRAAHGGREGAALAVIANSIQQLATEALVQTRALEGGFRQIMTEARTLETDRLEETPAELCAEASLLLSHLQGINSDLASAMRQAEAAAIGLAEDIRKTADRLSAHEQFAEKAQAIEEILRRQAQQRGGEINGVDAAVFQDIYSRYTMQSERKVHEGQLSGGKVIDLEQHRAARRGSELGENVELF